MLPRLATRVQLPACGVAPVASLPMHGTPTALLLLLAAVSTATSPASVDDQSSLQLREVFRAGEPNVHGFNVSCFRIPGFLVANSTLLVVAEARNYGGGDGGQHDLVAKRSLDWGQTWGPLQMVVEPAKLWGPSEGGPKGATVGDPTAVYDSDTGAMHMVFEYNPSRYQDHSSQGHPLNLPWAVELWMVSSSDNMATWTPRNLSAIKPTLQPGEPQWCNKAGAGGGHGIQLRHGPHAGRLIIPGYHSYCSALPPVNPHPTPPPPKAQPLSAWLVFDFGAPRTLDGFRFFGVGDGTHDVKVHSLHVLRSDGQWESLGVFQGTKGSRAPQPYSFKQPYTGQKFRWLINSTFPSAATVCKWTGMGGCQPDIGEIEFHQAAEPAGVYLQNNGTASHSVVTSSSGGETPENPAWKVSVARCIAASALS